MKLLNSISRIYKFLISFKALPWTFTALYIIYFQFYYFFIITPPGSYITTGLFEVYIFTDAVLILFMIFFVYRNETTLTLSLLLRITLTGLGYSALKNLFIYLSGYMPEVAKGQSLFQLAILTHFDTFIRIVLYTFGFSYFKVNVFQKQKILHEQNRALELKNKNLEMARDQAMLKLNSLNAKTDPHFLFNSLSFIYAAGKKEEADKTTEAILLLSKIMQYKFTAAPDETLISLKDELAIAASYIRLYALLNDGGCFIQIQNTTDEPDITIMPYMIIGLIENMLKYAVLDDATCPATVSISITSDTMIIKSSNRIQSGTPAGNRTGFVNLAERLSVFYNGRAKFNYVATKDFFVADIECPV